jgi:Spy/CpxP family protein refolding chaperone
MNGSKFLAAAVAGLALAATGAVMADGPKRGPGKHHPFAGLDLTDEQRERIGTIVREHRAQAAQDRTVMRDAIREVLTAEQVAQLEARRAERGTRGDRPRHRGHGGSRG